MIRRFLYTLAVMCFILNLFISAIFLLSFNRGYYAKMYARLEVAQTIGVSDHDLNRATDALLAYVSGNRETLDLKVAVNGYEIEMFNQREKDHMIDVKALYQSADCFRFVTTIFVATMILTSIGVGDYIDLKLNRDCLQTGLMILFMIIGFLGTYALLDFESFWIHFHTFIFSNDLWLLNPNVDRLIMMVPYEFFLGLVTRIVIAISAIYAACVGVWFRLNKVVAKNDTRRIV